MWIESFEDYRKACPHLVNVCLQHIMKLCADHLSECYSIYTYRYFLYSFSEVCLLTWESQERQHLLGVLVGRLEPHVPKWATSMISTMKPNDLALFPLRGYIAMIVVDRNYRRTGIGSSLVRLFIERVHHFSGTEIVLETEISNLASLCLYRQLGFRKEKRLFRYYLNGSDAFRLFYDIRLESSSSSTGLPSLKELFSSCHI